MYDIFEKLLKLHNVTSYKVSKDTGIPYAALSDWKAGRSTPKQDKLQKIADYFNVSVDYLLGRDKEMEITVQFKSDDEAAIYLDILSNLEKMSMKGLEEARRYLSYLSALKEFIDDSNN